MFAEVKKGVFLILGAAFLILFWMGVQLIPHDIREFASFTFFGNELFPFAPMHGFRFEQLMLQGIWLVLGGGAVYFISKVVHAVWNCDRDVLKSRNLLAVVASSSVAFVFALIMFLFKGRGIVSDENSYRNMASMFSEGLLGRLESVNPVTAVENFEIYTKWGASEKYLFGEPLVQIPGLILGLPSLMHVPLAALSIWLVYHSAKLIADLDSARWAAILLAVSPMFVFTSATGLSHVSSLFGCALALYGYCRCKAETPDGGEGKTRQKGGWVGPVLCGAGIGFAMCVRPQSGFPVGVVLGVGCAWTLMRRRSWKQLAMLAGASAPFAAAILVYDWLMTGNPFRLPWSLFLPVEHYGFGPVVDNSYYEHTFLRGIRNLAVVLVRLNMWWLGWPLSLWIAWRWLKAGHPMEKGKILVPMFLATMLFLFCYHSPGVSETGPVYHFEWLLPLCILGGITVSDGLKKDAKRWTSVLIVNFALGTVPFYIVQTNQLSRLVEDIHGQSDLAIEKIASTGRKAYVLSAMTSDEGTVIRGWSDIVFPKRFRSPSHDNVLTYPRPYPEYLDSMMSRFPDRDCYFYRPYVDEETATLKHDLWRCETPEAQAILRRPYVVPKGSEIQRIVPTTAETLWFVRPDGVHWGEAFDFDKWIDFLNGSL